MSEKTENNYRNLDDEKEILLKNIESKINKKILDTIEKNSRIPIKQRKITIKVSNWGTTYAGTE